MKKRIENHLIPFQNLFVSRNWSFLHLPIVQSKSDRKFVYFWWKIPFAQKQTKNSWFTAWPFQAGPFKNIFTCVQKYLCTTWRIKQRISHIVICFLFIFSSADLFVCLMFWNAFQVEFSRNCLIVGWLVYMKNRSHVKKYQLSLRKLCFKGQQVILFAILYFYEMYPVLESLMNCFLTKR